MLSRPSQQWASDVAPAVVLALPPERARLLLFLAREGARSVGGFRRLPSEVADLLAELAAAVYAAGTESSADDDPRGSWERLSVSEFARTCGMTPSYVRRQCRAGTLPAEKLGPVWAIGPVS